MNKDRVCRVATVGILLIIVVSFNFDLTTVDLQRILSREYRLEDPTPLNPGLNSSSQGFHHDSPKTPPKDSSSKGMHHEESSKTPPKVRELLAKLRETARLAADGHDDDYILTAEERAVWHEKNPCQSRSEMPAIHAARKHVKHISSNPMWDQVLDEYSNLHRICMKKVGNVSELFINKSDVTVPGCKFVVGEGIFGLGNKILATASALLYAIVSQRVFLVPSRMTFGTIFCEPFVGSSWLLDADTFPMPRRDIYNNTWEEPPVFREKLHHILQELSEEGQQRGNYSDLQSRASPPLVDAIVVAAMWSWPPWVPEKWFFCNTEQTFLAEVPWIYYSGCIYTIPDLYGSTPFGSTLQALFPDRMVITHVLRSTFLPSDDVWTRFKHLNLVYFQNVDRRVGIQLRFFHNSHSTMSGVMNDRILNCALNNGILPKLNETIAEQQSNTSLVSAPITTVFIASLHSELHDHLSEFYLRRPTVTGEEVGVVQITIRKKQRTGTEEDTEALVEMLLLSVSDSLMVSPASTFGGVGQAYGGLTPWITRSTPESDGVDCERSQSVDPCQQIFVLGYDCPFDPPSPPNWQGILKECLTIDLGGRIPQGFQILDHHLSS
ncbi:unnamed protein product [Calypogeia fissa]